LLIAILISRFAWVNTDNSKMSHGKLRLNSMRKDKTKSKTVSKTFTLSCKEPGLAKYKLNKTTGTSSCHVKPIRIKEQDRET